MKARKIRRKAKELAMFHGGKMAYALPGDGMMINAFIVGKSEGWWNYGRGLYTGDLLSEYSNRHWKEFIKKAAQEIA